MNGPMNALVNGAMDSAVHGALLVNKHDGVTSFGIIELLQREWMERHGCKKRDAPKLGHGGTLDPFATGLLIVLVGRAVKLAQYFLGATKGYEGVIRFGETSVAGDPTGLISEKSDCIPESLSVLQDMATRFKAQPYLQTPPMHSAKKKNGKPLYELARAGIEIEREPKLCHLYQFDVLSYEHARAGFRLKCSSGTYVRTLAQDYARLLGSVALLESLHRTSSGIFRVEKARTVQEICEAGASGKKWDQLDCWIPFDKLLNGYSRAEATESERLSLTQGQQAVLFDILKRTQPPEHSGEETQDCVAIYSAQSLIAIARREEGAWGLDRVFT